MGTQDLLFWNRIEPHPRSEDIKGPLKARIHDPLWMLSRQWQLGEFQAEDAGKATSIKLSYQKYLPQYIQDRKDNKTFFNGKHQPLEAVVESTNYNPDLFTRVEIGRQWFRLLEKNLSEKRKEEIINAFHESKYLQFSMPDHFNKYQKYEHADILSNKTYIHLLASLEKGGKIDGGILVNIIAEKHYLISEYILGEENAEVDFIGRQLLDWVQRIYNVNIGKNAYWSNQHLEHQFGLDLGVGQNSTEVLQAEEYFGGELDWYQFDKPKAANLLDNETDNPNPASPDPEHIPTLTKYFQYPSEVKYKGMPNSRWWELEDGTTNFGNIKADSTGTSALVFTQFNLLYSNDWLMMPLEMERGTLSKITEMVVTDNFGIRTLVKHLHETVLDENWGLFQIHDRNFTVGQQNDTCLLVPSVIDDLQKGEPLEVINFLRDEMANMVWAVEKKVPDHLGNGINGDEAVERVKQFLAEIGAPNHREELPNSAKVKYQMATEVPGHYIPFVPRQIKNNNLSSRQIQLQRASMPRIIDGFKPTRIRPQTALLSQGLTDKKRKPLYVFEEEVPKSGAIIKGRWKRVRWLNGETIIWYAYEKTNGRGEGNSGLKFDQILHKKE